MNRTVPRIRADRLADYNHTDTLSIDIETYSEVDLKKCGLYKYASDPSFEILLFAYKWNSEPVQVVDLANFETIPEHIEKALTDPKVLKKAWNAQFEFFCLSTIYPLIQEQWRCTMVHAATMSLPMQLGACAKALEAPLQKDFNGSALIKYFCVPVEPTKANGMRTRNYAAHAPDKWERFKYYCIRDVEVEDLIGRKLNSADHVTTFERGLYFLDQYINSEGIKVDKQLIENAIKIDEQIREELLTEARQITGLQNPNSVSKLATWLSSELDEEVEKVNKEKVLSLLKRNNPEHVQRVLEIRQLLSKSSVKKYTAMYNSMDEQDVIHGLLQIYGASRTGRWAGRLVQVQNLPRISMKSDELEFVRNLVKEGDTDTLHALFNNIPNLLSELIRTAFVASEGCELHVADLSAIEARMLAWLANEKWRLDVFNSHGKIYEASAAMMFHIPIDQIGEESEERQRGKVAELALGYGGGVGALTTMDIKKKLKEAEKQPLVDAWRAANRAIVAYWRLVEDAAIRTVQTGQRTELTKGMYCYLQRNVLYIKLPSGRNLVYLRPRLVTNKFGNGLALTYMGQDQKTNKWSELDTYGGKLVENIVQAASRDILAEALVRLDQKGYKTVMHVHDEIIADQPIGFAPIKQMCDIMCESPAWGKGLPLAAKGFISQYYKK